MTGFKCSYCNADTPLMDNITINSFYFSFDKTDLPDNHYSLTKSDSDAFEIKKFKCAGCGKITHIAYGIGKDVECIVIPLKPQSNATQYPDYIPSQLRNDYEEASKILNLSPKASATLSRRCLQGIIRDFWNIHEKNLNAEISALKDKIDVSLWKAMDKVRSIGNIGAHMENDVNLIIEIDTGEAKKLIKFIELLFKECYIAKFNREQLLNEIIVIGADKECQRKKD